MKIKHEKLMKVMWLVLAILLTLQSVPSGAQQPWTIDECMDYAIAHNTGIKQLKNEQRRREIKAQASKDARLPRLEGDVSGFMGTLRHSGSGNRFNANVSLMNMGLMGMVPLYTGSRLSSQIKADKYSHLAAMEDVRAAERDLRIQVAATYLQLLYNKSELSIVRQQQDVSQLLLKQAQSLYKRGKRPVSDVVEAEALVSRDEAMLAAAEGNVTLAMFDLRQLLNLPDSVRFDVCEPSDTIDTLSPLLELSSLASHPEVLSDKYNIQQAEQQVKVARSCYYPSLMLVGEFGTFWGSFYAKASHRGWLPLLAPWGSLGDFNYHFSNKLDLERKNFLHGVVGLRLSIPIFNAFETKSQIRTAKMNLEDAKLAYDDTRKRISNEIRHAWQEAVTAFKQYEAEIKAENSSALAYRYAQKRYDAGMSTLYDLNQSRQQWFTAAENALRMKYEYLIRKRILDIQNQE
ncbi:MAG: TolC family protein [Bacteroidaceae bacterium]|nr:TolC family protein [Bacteroidaceae bacterium]